ncbi:MAG: hypothetical protein EPN79_16090 [Burkholderiaceae bacterium]|nr:MAG: hypothetical protein EPN79_16090 [Burkholderiaceae bacterium]
MNAVESTPAEQSAPLHRIEATHFRIPADWTGGVQVRGCVLEDSGTITGADAAGKSPMFWGVYARSGRGGYQHVADFLRVEHAELLADLMLVGARMKATGETSPASALDGIWNRAVTPGSPEQFAQRGWIVQQPHDGAARICVHPAHRWFHTDDEAEKVVQWNAKVGDLDCLVASFRTLACRSAAMERVLEIDSSLGVGEEFRTYRSLEALRSQAERDGLRVDIEQVLMDYSIELGGLAAGAGPHVHERYVITYQTAQGDVLPVRSVLSPNGKVETYVAGKREAMDGQFAHRRPEDIARALGEALATESRLRTDPAATPPTGPGLSPAFAPIRSGMSWKDAAKMLLAALENGPAESKREARQQVLEMAKAADRAVRLEEGSPRVHVEALRSKGHVVVLWSEQDVPDGVQEGRQEWLAKHGQVLGDACVDAGNQVLEDLARSEMATRNAP